MRFAAAAVIASSALAYAQETVVATSTRLHTIIDCEDDTPDCPAKTSTEIVPLTTKTVYQTQLHTIVDCEDDVPDCPGHSTIVVTESVPVSTTICPVDEPTYVPVPPPSNGTIPHPPKPEHPEQPEKPEVPEKPEQPETPEKPEQPEKPEVPEKPEEPECPAYTTTVVTKSHVTTIYEEETKTVEVPCPPTDKPQPPSPPVVTPPPHGNDTVPPPPPATGGAAAFAGSAIFAAAAGLAAFILV